jgi:hypothetical protein
MQRLQCLMSRATGPENRVRDINGLAQNPIGYRYTIPKYL